ncbi:hypothetical protein [Falsiroseomonas selenitidurans]|uniref:Uncharacterized protein n=1 Tax=Falsiroseomonas selenitidurans TaxID=2716335 RepID=A0ABX1E4Q3_9PROT|nr:hypothetical protein [Falsiroseomonas selenitidurans]NKC32165.1 hypothetical protein [Falsiroseomonas selenitidurans]
MSGCTRSGDPPRGFDGIAHAARVVGAGAGPLATPPVAMPAGRTPAGRRRSAALPGSF